MSIIGMNRTAVARAARAQAGRAPVEPLFGAAAGTGAGAADTKAPLEALVRYIPTEAIVLYVGLLGAVGSSGAHYTGRWVAFAIFLAATPVLVLCDWAIRRRRAERPDPGLARRLLAFNLVAATLAFAAWGFSLPASPFGQISWYDQHWASFVALVVAVVLGKAEALVLPLG